MEAEEVQHRKTKLVVNGKVIEEMRKDVDFGMLFSNLVMFFIILTTGTVLFNSGIHQIDSVEEAAQALRPLAGESAYLLFALGIIGTGLLAIPVLSGSLSYIIMETFGWEKGLDKKFHEAKAFYVIIDVYKRQPINLSTHNLINLSTHKPIVPLRNFQEISVP